MQASSLRALTFPVLVGDEKCKKTEMGFDGRTYFTSVHPELGYLPLGPRKDTFTIMAKILAEAPLIPASSRHYVYNALFATSSHYNRGVLAKVIAENRESSGMRSFVHVPDRWGNDTKSMLTQEDYVQVLLRSVFTLAPTGHNPECFRLHEAVEAGSIPIFATGDYYAVIPCKGSIDPWLESPMITLRSWDELYPTMKSLLQDPLELDRRQNEMRSWYVSYMRAAVWDFETFVLSGYQDPYT